LTQRDKDQLIQLKICKYNNYFFFILDILLKTNNLEDQMPYGVIAMLEEIYSFISLKIEYYFIHWIVYY